MRNLEKRLSQLEESQPIANVRPLTDAERAVRIVRMLATGALDCERVREFLKRCTGITLQAVKSDIEHESIC